MTRLLWECIMDYPEAWAFVGPTRLSQHDPKCSYRATERALLCDCDIIWNEYERRKLALIGEGPEAGG